MSKCLILDDSEVICFVTRRIVEKLGHQVLEATNITDAIAACRTHEPDFVLLDWDLPGLGALDFLKNVSLLDAERRPEIILCATENDAQQFALAKAAGAHFHLLKPFDFDSVSAVLKDAGFVDTQVADAPETKTA